MSRGLSSLQDMMSTTGAAVVNNLILGELNGLARVGKVLRGKLIMRNAENTLAGRIKIAMSAVGIGSPSELARKMKVPRQTVHNWMSGDRDKVTPEMLFKLSDALKVNPRWLALGMPNSPTMPAVLSPDDHELLEIKRSLDPKALEDWVSSGRTMVRLTAKASTANPFGLRVK